MFDGTLVQQLKQSNISIDTEKTKQRAADTWKASTAGEKKAILELAGVARSTIYRIHSIGSISAKLVIPHAQILNLNPLLFNW